MHKTLISKIMAFVLLLCATALPACADTFAKPYTWATGAILPAVQLNADFDTLYNGVNGNLSDINIKSGAGINPAKLGSGTALDLMLTGNPTWASGITGDTVARIELKSEGSLQMGPGGASAVDTGIYRTGAGALTLGTTSSATGAAVSCLTLTLTNGTLAGALTLPSGAQNLFLATPSSGSGVPAFRAIASGDLPAGTGTVTSVAMTGDNVVFASSVSGSPITTSGTFAPALKSQSANTVFGNFTGSSAAPTFLQGVTNGTFLGMSGGSLGFFTPPSSAQSVTTAQCGGRLYGTSGHPYGDTASGTATIYYGPAVHNRIDIDNGSGTIVNQTFSEASLSIAALTASTAYDVYATSASTTTITLSTSAWTGNTPPARGTDAAGRLTKTGATQSLLVGVVYVDSVGGATIDSAGERDLWNIYNRYSKPLACSDSTANWNSWNGTTWAQANGSQANGTGRVAVFAGDADAGAISLTNFSTVDNITNGDGAAIGIQVDAITGTPLVYGSAISTSASNKLSISVSYATTVSRGEHYYQRMEEGITASGVFYGNGQSGMYGTWAY